MRENHSGVTSMEVIIFGAGAIGSFIGALFQLQGNVVGLVGRADHVSAIKKQGLILEDSLSKTTLTVQFSHVATTLAELLTELPSPDWIIITTKAWANETISRILLQENHRLQIMNGPDSTKIALFQNGMGNELPFLKQLKLPVIYRGVTAHGCLFKKPGHVTHVGVGFTKLGLISKKMLLDSSNLGSNVELLREQLGQQRHESLLQEGKKLCSTLTEAGMACEWEDDLLPSLYMKMAVNCVINSLTAVFEVPNGEISVNAHVRPIFEHVLDEVGRSIHVLCPRLSLPEIKDTVLQVVTQTAANYSSTLQDLLAGRKTEIDYLCGYLLSRAKERNMYLPHLATLMAIIKTREERGNVKHASTPA